ncbi:MAG: FUSC family protein [Alphaproteobacteria bacterium]|nr:FUSC family protein [Alphaproteobacteria bacterium]
MASPAPTLTRSVSLSRSLGLAVFRAHIENGLSVAIGVGLTGLAAGTLGFSAAISAGMGALCVSISDRNDPLSQKLWIMGMAFTCACVFTALSAFSTFSLPAFIAVTAFTGLWTGLISAYGRWVLSLAMTCVLAFVLTMGEHFTTVSAAADHLLLFVCGALIYTTYAVTVAWVFDDRGRRLLLAEAMRAFSGYLRAKAALYNPDAEGPGAFRALIDAHATLVDRMQAARDSLFARRSHRLQLKRIDTLVALLDAFETVLSSDADIEYLRRAPHRDLMWRLNRFVHDMADDVDGLTLALRSRRAHTSPRVHETEAADLLAAVDAALAAAPGDRTVQALLASANKLVLADRYVADLARALDKDTPPSTLAASLDLDLFRAATPRGYRVLLRQFTMTSPALRYGLRLALAMTTGLLVTLLMPRFAHANWVLLTIALIMRANYSVTRQRRWDRVTGTLIGCALAVLFIYTLPTPVLLLVIVLAVGTNHAYGMVKYRITAIGASVLSLLLLHFADPLLHPQFFERIIDTLIGAGLSWAFSYLLPSWERNDLPGTVRGLLAADAAYAAAALRREHVMADYRLARKKVLDAVAQLSGAIRRLADEPNANRRAVAGLGALLGANYLLASDLSSMPVLVKLRAHELDAGEADAAIDAARARVMRLLDPADPLHGSEADARAPRVSISALQGSEAMEVLARRLDHIEHTARRVAHLAARPSIENL